MKLTTVLRSTPFIALLALSTYGCAPHGRCHARMPMGPGETLSVTGEGEAKSKPDQVRLTLGVEAKSEDLDAALADATKRINGLHDALLKLGVSEEDMKTGQLSIGNYREPITVHVPSAAPTTTPEKPGAKSVQAAPPATMVTEERWVERYVVSTNFEVVFKNVSKTGDLIKAAVGAGANQGWGIQFELSDPKPLEEAARTKALTDAKKRAEQLAREGGVKLGRVLAITEGGPAPGPMPMMRAPMMMKSAESSMNIEGGQTAIHSTVSVVYAIEE